MGEEVRSGLLVVWCGSRQEGTKDIRTVRREFGTNSRREEGRIVSWILEPPPPL